jgi:2,3-dihydroxybenzoate decarboxylase
VNRPIRSGAIAPSGEGDARSSLRRQVRRTCCAPRCQGLAAVPLQDPRLAAAELRRAGQELGLCGALVNDHTLGHYLDEPQYEPFWETLQDLEHRVKFGVLSPVEVWGAEGAALDLKGPRHRAVLARAGSADEVAQVIMFLASPAASYLTGSQFTVDGGVLPVV